MSWWHMKEDWVTYVALIVSRTRMLCYETVCGHVLGKTLGETL